MGYRNNGDQFGIDAMKDSQLKHFLLSIWDSLFNAWDTLRKTCLLFADAIYQWLYAPPSVVSVEESIRYIVANKCSVARYGDGEMKLIMGRDISFQKCHPVLRQCLADTLKSYEPELIVCIPNVFSSLDIYTEHDKKFWREYLSRSRRTWYKLLDKSCTYYDAFVSRCYLPYQDKSKAVECFHMWKQLWNGRDLLIIEGAKTRFGIGNDLFDNVRSVRRILAPIANAFERYDELLNAARDYENDTLILIALGPTATVMAADLCLAGYQAIDIGHLDIEYEWFLKKVDHKVPVEGKYVNEAGGYSGNDNIVDKKYQSQIVKVFE